MKKVSWLALTTVGLLLSVACSRLTEVRVLSQGDVLYKQYQIDQDSLRQGPYLTYFGDGVRIFEQAHYKDDLLDGKRTLYFEHQQPEVIEQYHKGVLVDTLKVFYPSGQLKRTEYYSKGTVEGEVISYFPNGAVKERVTYQNNLENGPFSEYYANGQLKWQGTFINGDNEIGELLKYDSTGRLIRVLICDSLAICKTQWSIEDGVIEEPS